MEIVQVIGSYAGFAAIVGLAILSALYFSQARDVRRLREWAGRAPERASQQETAIAPGSQTAPAARAPGAAQPAAAQQPVPANAPVPAAASGGAAAPTGEAVTTSKAPAPAAAAGAPKPAVAAAAANNATATQPSPVPAPGAPASGPATAAEREGTATAPPPGPPALPGVVPLGADRAAATPPVGRPAPPGAATPRRVPQPSPAPEPERQPWYLRLAPRYITLIVAGVLIVGGGVAYGVTQLSTGASPAQRSAQPAPAAQEGDDGTASPQAPVDPGQVTVSVLNGTTVAGLARRVSDELRRAGFRKGRTDNATEQARAESVVFYADGSERAARAVGEQLSIGQRQPITGDARALAGNADVVVVLGADKM